MKAVEISKYGGPEVLSLVDTADLKAGRGEVLVQVKAVGVNRADLLQRAGHYPPPGDVSQKIPGLEYAGEIVALGDGVTALSIGDRVCGLAGGGTYAEQVVVPAGMVCPIPDDMSWPEAAGIPEAYITAYDAMVSQMKLSAGETVLIHAAGSGVGVAAIQIATAIGARAIVTSRSTAKVDAALALGAESGIIVNNDGSFALQARALTAGRGVDLILELVGASYFTEDIRSLSLQGRIIVVGLVSGTKAEIDLGLLLRNRLTICGTTLRMRPLEEKIFATRLLRDHMMPLFENKKLRAIIDRVFPFTHAAAAHEYMEKNANFGKVVLNMEDSPD